MGSLCDTTDFCVVRITAPVVDVHVARPEPGLALIQLSVESTNEPAKSLYTSFGFQTYGIERQAIFVDGDYFDEELMALKLDLPTG